MNVLTPEEIMLRLGIAVFCGLFVGLDREIKHKNVGVRTYLLVCLGAAGFSLMTLEMTHFYTTIYKTINPDPTRVIQGVVTGIGFLGGGAILQAKGHVTGVATGASIWVCGAIGVACGYGFYWHAVIMAGYAFFILAIVGWLRVKCRGDLESDEGDVANNQKKKS